MRDYFCSDLIRIAKRIPRMITILIGVAMMVLYCFILFKLRPVWNRVEFISGYQNAGGFLIMALGLVELISVFADDFKAKTMQIGIGIGISRPAIVLCKFLEVVVLTAADLVLLAIGAVIFACLTGAAPAVAQYSDLLIINFCNWLDIISTISLSIILAFFMQSTGLATILYLVLSADITSALAGALLTLGILEPLRLNTFLLSNRISVLQAQLLTGNFNAGAFVCILLYILFSYLITIALFNKRELEF